MGHRMVGIKHETIILYRLKDFFNDCMFKILKSIYNQILKKEQVLKIK